MTPVDVLCGGFPCQDISTAGKKAGLAPGTRSGLWSHMAEAIDVLQPRQVVIENVRGLLSARAIRPQMQGATDQERNRATPSPATPGDLESAMGVWETTQPDLFGLTVPYSEIWPTCGTTHNGSAYQLPFSALLTTASVSSSSPPAKTLFRTPLASDSSRGGRPWIRSRPGVGRHCHIR